MTDYSFAQEVLNWEFKHPVSNEWINAGIKGSVQEVLLAKGELPDPFYGKNEEKYGWIEEHIWEFRSSFDLTEAQLNSEFIELDFQWIDTYADVYLNDSILFFACNSFRPYIIRLNKDQLKAKNELKAIFYPPVIYHKEMYDSSKYHLPAPNDAHPVAVAPYTRKAQYQFGWDWALRMNTLGFIKPVKLLISDQLRVLLKNVTTNSILEDEAHLSLMLEFNQPLTNGIIWKSELFGEEKYETGLTKVTREVWMEQPKLWWPNGQGEQNLYDDIWTISDLSGNLIHQLPVRFGVRTSELIQETDQWGTSYVISVNGRRIFCLGANYIPQDIFPSRVKDDDIVRMIENMKSSNFNMVRVWGGGYYPDDIFYEKCDELGIMVWQDFMFACAIYPGDQEFLHNIEEEFNYQIPRISSHPSVVLFNGNNEVDVAWKNWGFQVRYNIYGKDAKEVERSYERVFQQLLPSLMNKYTTTPYVHTSPLSNWGKEEFYNHGSQHYWGVWHGKDPMENFALKVGRFNAEYGFQSFPEYSTLSKFSTKEDWDVQSEVMKHHQKSYVGNLMILKHAKLLFGMPESFEDFVYYSQLTQATAVSMAVTGHRLDAPRCMGTLYWQLNDCWPAPTWSSMDHYFNWKALQYWVKKDYQSVAVLSTGKGVESKYHLVSDVLDTFMCQLSYSVFDLNGKLLFTNDAGQLVKGFERSKICMKPLEGLKDMNTLISFEWKDQNGQLFKRSFSRLVKDYTKANENDVVIDLQDVGDGNYIVKLKVKKYVSNFWILAEIPGVEFEDNFIDLVPGEYTFRIKSAEPLKKEQLSAKWM